MQDKADSKQEFYGVQALRAAAALAVVAGHSTDYLQAQNGFLPSVFQWIHGPAGVDLFFVISGFVMMISSTRLLEKAHPSRLFLWRRIIRIVPLYWILTLVKYLIVQHDPALSAHPQVSTWNIASSFLFIPSANAAGEIRPLIVLGWTLSFEMMFYVLFALALLRGRRFLQVLIPAIVVVAGLGVARQNSWPAWTALADPIVLEFLAGVGIGWLVMHGKLPKMLVSAAFACLGLAGLVLLSSPATTTIRPATWGLSALLLVLGVVAMEKRVGRMLPKWLLVLGDASYSIYLIQAFIFPVLHIIMAKAAPRLIHEEPVTAGIIMIATSVVSTALVGVVVYRVLEKPLTEQLRRLTQTNRPVPVPS